MSGSLNKVTLIGNVCGDPEARSMSNGGEVVNFTVATNESWKDKQTGEKKDKAEFHRIVIFNEHLGKVAKDYLRKGSTVYVEGALQTRKWQDNSGADKYSTEIVLQRYRGELTLLGDRPASAPATDRGLHRGPTQRPSSAGGIAYDDELDSDVPFITCDPVLRGGLF